MKSFFILFLVVFFGSITNGKMPNKEYREFDLYTESSFYKDGKKFQVTELSLKQSNELRDILSKYNLFVEGKTESTFPFIGTLAIFYVTIDKKPYLLCMINNTNHIFAEMEMTIIWNSRKLGYLNQQHYIWSWRNSWKGLHLPS